MADKNNRQIVTGNDFDRQLKLHELPVSHRNVTLGDVFMISDNLDSSQPLEAFTLDQSSKIRLATPFKIRFTMVLICVAGRMRIRLNMEEYLMEKGCMLTTIEGMIGECLEITADSRLIMIAFSKEFPLVGPNVKTMSVIGERLIRHPLIRINDEDLSDIISIYNILRKKILVEDFPYKNDMASASIQTIYCMVSSYLLADEEGGRHKADRKQQIFEEFMRLVGEHSTRQRNLSFYADKLCLSPKYLSQVVFDASGRTAREWICSRVILEAKALLKSERLAIQQISEMLNFANQSFFGVFFKRATGRSPKSYREEI